MKEYEYIIQQVRKYHFSGWNDEELRKCIELLRSLSRKELLLLYQSKWLRNDKAIKDAIFNLLFKEKIGERDRKIKAMTVDELIKDLNDEKGYGKFIVLEMKDRYETLNEEEKIKIIDALSITTKTNQKWAESKRKHLNSKIG